MRFSLLSIVIFFLALCAQGQNNEKYQKYKRNYNYRRGYIITWDSVKLEGLIKDNMMSETRKFSKIIFVSKDGIKSKYSPSEIQEFKYSGYKFISDSSSFYQRIYGGSKVSLYKNMSANYMMGGSAGPGLPAMGYSSTSVNYYVRKTNETEFKLVKKSGFKSEFVIYFGDCESLKIKIENKELKSEDIRQIVAEYNSCC